MILLKDIFFVSKEISVLMPRNTPHWSLEKYIDFAHFAHTLLCLAGSPFTVGIIDGESCYPPVFTTPKCLYVMSGIIQVTPETVNVMSANPRPTHVMPATPGVAHIMPVKSKFAHAMSTKSRLDHIYIYIYI